MSDYQRIRKAVANRTRKDYKLGIQKKGRKRGRKKSKNEGENGDEKQDLDRLSGETKKDEGEGENDQEARYSKIKAFLHSRGVTRPKEQQGNGIPACPRKKNDILWNGEGPCGFTDTLFMPSDPRISGLLRGLWAGHVFLLAKGEAQLS